MAEEKDFVNESTQTPTEPVLEDDNRQSVKEESIGKATGPGNTDDRADESEPKGESDGYIKHVQNWRDIRIAKERAEQERLKLQKERDELAARIAQTTQQNGTRSDEPILNDDDLAEGKHLKHYQQKTAQQMASLEQKLVDAQIRAKFNDFDQVVNEDTVGMLRDMDPDLASSLAANTNPYSQAVAVYNTIRRYGLDKSSYEKEKISKNTAKPRTVNSLNPQQSESPLSRANAFAEGMTDEMKEARWKEAQRVLGNS